MFMQNIPVIKLGVVAVSRDCFPIELSRKRRKNVISACKKTKVPVIEIETVVENERDVLKALDELKKKDVNALALYLREFWPGRPDIITCRKVQWSGHVVAAAEDTGKESYQWTG